MAAALVPVLTVLVSVAVRGIALAELLARLRWQERQQRAHGASVTALVRALPRGSRLDETRADGSELHLVITQAAGPGERPPR